MYNLNVEKNNIEVNGNRIEFKYTIEKAKQFNDMVIVLLEYRNSYNPVEFTNQVYAVNNNGVILWQMQDVRDFDSNIVIAPLVGLNIINNNIVAIDFYARKYFLNPQDGRIIRLEAGRW